MARECQCSTTQSYRGVEHTCEKGHQSLWGVKTNKRWEGAPATEQVSCQNKAGEADLTMEKIKATENEAGKVPSRCVGGTHMHQEKTHQSRGQGKDENSDGGFAGRGPERVGPNSRSGVEATRLLRAQRTVVVVAQVTKTASVHH